MSTLKHYKIAELKEEWLTPKLSRRIISGSKETLGYFVLLKGSTVASHKHVNEQISVPLKGALKFTIDGKELTVKEGEVLIIPPNVEHAALAIEDSIVLDCFSPTREDWLAGKDDYLRK